MWFQEFLEPFISINDDGVFFAVQGWRRPDLESAIVVKMDLYKMLTFADIVGGERRFGILLLISC